MKEKQEISCTKGSTMYGEWMALHQVLAGNYVTHLLFIYIHGSLVPRLSCGGGGERAWYTLFAHVSSSLGKLAYYSATLNYGQFCLPAERPDYMVILLMRLIWAAFKFDGNCLHCFIQSKR